MDRGTWNSKARSTVKQRPWRVRIRKGKGRGKGGWERVDWKIIIIKWFGGKVRSRETERGERKPDPKGKNGSYDGIKSKATQKHRLRQRHRYSNISIRNFKKVLRH